MLQFQIKEQLYKRGITTPHKWLTTIGGLSRTSATRLLNGQQKSINLRHLTNICANLSCSPNDLLYYKDQKKYHIGDNHPLRTQLKDPPALADWKKIIKNLSPQDAADIFEQIQERLNNNSST